MLAKEKERLGGHATRGELPRLSYPPSFARVREFASSFVCRRNERPHAVCMFELDAQTSEQYH